MSAAFVLINGEFVPTEQAKVHVSDLAIQRGYGIFDFFQTVNGRAAFIEHHLDRFFHSVTRMRLELGIGREEMKGLLGELIKRNGIATSGVRITVTGGYSPDAYAIARPNLIVTQSPLKIDGQLMERGMRLITHAHRREFADVKTLNYLMAVWLQPVVKERGADDVLYQLEGAASECPRSNFWVVTKDGRVVTAADHVLKGVVRKQVLKMTPPGCRVEEGVVTVEAIRSAKEAFVTSTTKGVMPVVEVDGRPVGDGKPGEVTRWLGREFNARLASATA